MEKDILMKFISSVDDLSSKLPQWNSEDKTRVVLSALSSLFEEAGEISGVISKYRIRKDNYGKKPKELNNYDDAKTKFLDETGDLFWVIICTYCKLFKEHISTDDIFKILNDDYTGYCLSFEASLFDIIRDICLFEQQILLFSDATVDKTVVSTFIDLLNEFSAFLDYLFIEYEIYPSDICEYNMNKLGVRYDNEGNRLDNK